MITETCPFKISHRFVEDENNVYRRCTTPKNDITLEQEFAISQSARLRQWQPRRV